MTPDSTGQQDIRTYARIMWRWKLLFLAFLIPIPTAVYLFERGQPKVYQSSTLLELQNGTNGVGVPGSAGNVLAEARLVTTTPIAQKAALLLTPPAADPAALISEVHSSADTNTGFLTITADDHSPRRAASIATAFAVALGDNLTAQAIHVIELQIRPLVKQLARTPSFDSASRAAVTQQISELRAQAGGTRGSAQIVQPAVPNLSPVGPKTRRAVEIAFLTALLLGIGAVVLAENSDRRLRTPEDLEELTGWPLLGVIAPSAFAPGRQTARDQEAFQMLATSLTHFNPQKRLSSVAIVSPLLGDGKTTVAVGLAVATAHAGKEALLVDADLRRPQVSVRLGLRPGDGLGSVLAGRSSQSR